MKNHSRSTLYPESKNTLQHFIPLAVKIIVMRGGYYMPQKGDSKKCLYNSTLSMTNVSKRSETFSELSSEWFNSARPHLKMSTQNKYQNLLESYILPTYAPKYLEDITYDFISEQCNLLF